MFRMAGQTAGPIETKLDTRTHVHPGSVFVKVDVKVIHVCVREWQNYETPGKRHLANAYETPSGRRVITARVTRRGAAGAEQRAPKARVELRPEDGQLQLVVHNCIGLSRYIAITTLAIIAVFLEYLRQFLIDLHQIYRHSSVPKNTSPCTFPAF